MAFRFSCRFDQKRAPTEHFKQRAVTKFCINSGMTSKETLTFLCGNNDWKTCSRTINFDWQQRFWKGLLVSKTQASLCNCNICVKGVYF